MLRFVVFFKMDYLIFGQGDFHNRDFTTS